MNVNSNDGPKVVQTPKKETATKIRFTDVKKENSAPRIPILLYGEVAETDTSTNPNTISKQAFQEQMLFLKTNGYTTISINEFIAAYNGEIYLPKKSVLVTFDAGYRSLKMFINTFLIKNELNATAFVVGNQTSQPNKFLNEKDIFNIQMDHRFDIESQSFDLYDGNSNINFANVSDTAFQDDNKKMENLLGHKTRVFSYPKGNANLLATDRVKNANIKFGFTIKSGIADWVELNSTKTSPFGDKQNALSLPRVVIKPNTTVQQFSKLVTDDIS